MTSFSTNTVGNASTNERAYWLAWSRISGIGNILLGRLWERFGDLHTAWEASPIELAEIDGISLAKAEKIVQDRRELNPIALLRAYEEANPHFWTPSDPEYPPLLREIPDRPATLHYRGNPHLIEQLSTTPSIAIVGTRNPSDYGTRWTKRISQTLAQSGFTILSGLADGIDAIAHQACLDVQGSTIAVLGTGVDQVYPASNRQLYRDVIRQGLLLSEYPAGTKPDRSHFPQRNRIVAGLSRAVLVMEAGERSGALITAQLANDYGRDIYALAGSLDNPQSEGCINLIAQGAQIIPKPEKLLTLLGGIPQMDAAPQTAPQIDLASLPPELQPLATAIVELQNSAPLDLIVQTTGLPIALVSSGLLQLELMGIVQQDPGMRYRLANA